MDGRGREREEVEDDGERGERGREDRRAGEGDGDRRRRRGAAILFVVSWNYDYHPLFSFVFFMSSETSLENIQHDLSFWSENDDGFLIRGYSVGMHRYILI